jgi:hypothetical protein
MLIRPLWAGVYLRPNQLPNQLRGDRCAVRPPDSITVSLSPGGRGEVWLAATADARFPLARGRPTLLL